MAETTEISWAHSTFNPWIGCTRVSPGCDHCYAATLMDERYGRVKWGAGEARSRTKTWGQPLAWERKAAASGEPWRVFCASLADVFDNEVPDEWRTDLWALIAGTPHLTWMLLTKRIGNVTYPMPHNVWLGITVVNQEEAKRDIPKLLAVDAKVRWLSCEPLLGPLNLRPWMHPTHWHWDAHYDSPEEAKAAGAFAERKPQALVAAESRFIDWVIVGGESGKEARAMDPAWAQSIRDQCADARVPFHFKQWGGLKPKANGHLLDGAEHRAFPA